MKNHATLSDVNDELINVYLVIQKDLENLILKLNEFQLKHSKEFFLEIRTWDQEENYKSRPDFERAARFIYLNRTCFNGLYRVNGR
ncbi:DNA adenine methylase [bacterium]|nr:DNA adenine methylase [bacterium]